MAALPTILNKSCPFIPIMPYIVLDSFISKCFCQVSDQLCAKYSKEYGKLCRTNQIGTVNDRVGNFFH